MREGCFQAITIFLVALMVGILFAFLFAYIGMLLWNDIVVSLFGLPVVTYWQMFGLMVLVRLFIPMNISYKN
jgi:hypothetical protein